jgi:hypothetical protein
MHNQRGSEGGQEERKMKSRCCQHGRVGAGRLVALVALPHTGYWVSAIDRPRTDVRASSLAKGHGGVRVSMIWQLPAIRYAT